MHEVYTVCFVIMWAYSVVDVRTLSVYVCVCVCVYEYIYIKSFLKAYVSVKTFNILHCCLNLHFVQ